MDVKEFQAKLAELCALADQKDKTLDVAEIRGFFENMNLEQSQLLKVLQYLKARGITISGMELAAEETRQEEVKVEAVPLTADEKAYYKEYMDGLGMMSAAYGDLTARYLPVAAEMAVAMNCEEIPISDLIQEANISLLDALASPEAAGNNDTWIRLQIRKGIAAAIEEQTQQKYADEQLVEKVQKLENAIRELSEDDETTESQFSVNELAIILDMEIEEIQDILRLTGEES